MNQHRLYKDRSWSVQSDAEALLREILEERLEQCVEARAFSGALLAGTGVRLRDILDHLTFYDHVTAERIQRAGWVESGGAWEHPGGYFPAFVRRPGPSATWFRVESAELFARVHQLNKPIEGLPFGPARKVLAFAANESVFGAFERAGHSGYDIPNIEPELIRAAR